MLNETVRASTLKFAVLGEKLGHTWSPAIHNSLFAAAGRDAVYVPMTIDREHLPSMVDVLRSTFGGFNITIPYKVQILPLLDETDEAVKVCGAANTVENRDGTLIGHITDGLGMMKAIHESGVQTENQNVLILGAGGAARVAGYECLHQGCRVTWAARDPEKADHLARLMADRTPDGMHRIQTCTLSDIPKSPFDLIINCTPVGMYPNTDQSPIGEDLLSRCRSVFDAVYNPRETQLLRQAKAAGCHTVEGLGMLYYQAVAAQTYWFGPDIGVTPETQAKIYSELCARF